MDLSEQLQHSLGQAYTIERELGGGGMSRVFVAEERALGRQVVVKVLQPALGGGVNIERFEREIQLAASLQHPHIVPVLTAGETNGLPYYTMPFVEGESLRAKLKRDGPLPIADTLSILRDVARALAYAHERRVVHRDIKPDNVMLSGGSATVMDFGIAKALSAARLPNADAALTQVGTSIGTPAYMSPEQAAGDPSADARADLYSFGCMAYEMLTGQPPFVEKSPQQLLAAHMAKVPEPVQARRADTPPVLADLVMRCLAKDADDRPASAAQVLQVLDGMTSGAATGTAPAMLLAGSAMIRRALLVYAGVFIVVAALARVATLVIGLPDWVFPGALILMALGLPVVLATGYVQRVTHQAVLTSPAFTAAGSSGGGTLASMAIRASPRVTWRRMTIGGAFVIAGFVVLVGLFMATRALGIGPAASLLSSGKLADSSRILVADFRASGPDSVLGPVLAEAMRSSLSQSRAIRLMQTSEVAAALERMAKPADSKVDLTLGREIAQREGIKAIVTGDVTPLSGGYVVTARIIAAQTGDVLASYQQSANSAADLIPTMDKIGRKLRARIGESLRSVQNAPALAQATTSSLDALKLYTAASRANDVERKFKQAVVLLDSAIALDSNFAMAYRKLSVAIGNGGAGPGSQKRRQQVLQTAYDRRDHFGEAERLALLGEYWQNGPHPDRAKSIDAYEQLFHKYPEQLPIVGANNLALSYTSRREYARADSLFAIDQRLRPDRVFSYGNRLTDEVSMGKFADAMQNVALSRNIPSLAQGADFDAGRIQYAAGRIDSAEAAFRRALGSTDTIQVVLANTFLGWLALRQGAIADWRRYRSAAHTVNQARGITIPAYADSLEDIDVAYWELGKHDDIGKRLDAVVATMPAEARRSINLAAEYALSGRPQVARGILAHFDSSLTDTVARRLQTPTIHQVTGLIAMSEGQYATAIAEFRASDRLPDGPARQCAYCLPLLLGFAFDKAGQADSAIVNFQRYLDTPALERIPDDAKYEAYVERRLGELYDAKNDVANAMRMYQRYVDLWQHADAELQPQVKQVKDRLQQLTDAERRKG